MHQTMLKCVVYFAALVFLLFTFSCESDSKGLSLSPKSIDFGDVNLEESDVVDLIIKNKFGKDITLKTISLDGPLDFSFAANLPADYALADKTEVTIFINFEPQGPGEVTALLKIYHSESEKNVEVNVKGNGKPVPRIYLPETTYDYGQVLITGTGKTHTFEIQNNGTADLEISGFGLVGSNANSYSIVSGGNVPIIITPSGKHTVDIKFFSANVGTETATLEINHDAANEDPPATINLSADAVDRAGEISLNITSPWVFGNIPIGWVIEKSFVIENVGVDVLKVTLLSFDDGTAYTIKDILDKNGSLKNYPFDLPIGDTATVIVEYSAPSATTYNDKLNIEHDGTNENSPLIIDLQGAGKTAMNKSFTYSGAADTWTVPADIYLIKVTAKGAGDGGTKGGAGSLMECYLQVNPGDVLTVIVGGKGEEHTHIRSGGGGGGFTGLLDSANNHLVSAGGAGGTAGEDTTAYGVGGDGGGGNGGNGGCGQGGAGGVNGTAPSGGIGGTSGGNAGTAGTSAGGGNGGNGISNQAAGAGGGGYGTGKGIGGVQYSQPGKGGDGGFGGGWNSYVSRLSAGGGGGGGGGGSNYADSAKATILNDTKGGGSAMKTDGSLIIEY